ncbi:MAG: glycosyltransferase family 4 protein, partial [Proteobacteria bacterium]|nr:glycosyltransferase family 4 protein [Pseudomonadota bacterium]
ADLLSAPVAPWDALVCTSQAVAETVRRLHEAEGEALRWRFGRDVAQTTPQLPIIPLGVHCADFEFTGEERAAARGALGLAPDEVAALFVGRLTFSGKLNPFAMYLGLQAAAERTGKPLALLQCGWSPNETIGSAFVSGPEQFAPDIKAMVVDGRDPTARRQAWAAADLFISLSESVQETFGLTPVEAMAAGLPCVVSDWNGYRDTVRDGVDGFRIPTWAPRPGAIGREIAREQEVGALSYDGYLWAAAGATSVDHAALADALSRLIEDPGLRRTLGEAGRKRARETFDWSRIIRRYQVLWAELNARRAAALADPDEAAWIAAAPQVSTAAGDPYWAFGHYASAQIELSTRATLTEPASADALRARRGHMLFSGLRLPEAAAGAILARLATGPATVADLAQSAGLGPEATLYFVGILAKMGLVRLG